MVKKTKGRNTKALRGAELREIEKPSSSGEIQCRSLLGELVEVRHRGAGFRGSWHPARVVRIDENRGLVEYEKLLSKDGSLKFQEYVPLSEESEDESPRILLRPRPPPFVSPNEAPLLQRGLWVEAFFGDAWWEGVLMDDGVSESMQVFFPGEGDRRSFCMANLRVSQEWDNKTGVWRMKGKWTDFASIEGRKFKLKRTFAVQPKVSPRDEADDEPEKFSGDESLEKKLPEATGDEDPESLPEAADENLENAGDLKRKRDGEEGDSDDESLLAHWIHRHKKQREGEAGAGVSLDSGEPATGVCGSLQMPGNGSCGGYEKAGVSAEGASRDSLEAAAAGGSLVSADSAGDPGLQQMPGKGSCAVERPAAEVWCSPVSEDSAGGPSSVERAAADVWRSQTGDPSKQQMPGTGSRAVEQAAASVWSSLVSGTSAGDSGVQQMPRRGFELAAGSSLVSDGGPCVQRTGFCAAAGVWSTGKSAPVEESAAVGVWSSLDSGTSAPAAEEQASKGVVWISLKSWNSAPASGGVLATANQVPAGETTGGVLDDAPGVSRASEASLDSTPAPGGAVMSLRSPPTEEDEEDEEHQAGGGTLMLLDLGSAEEDEDEEAAGGTLMSLDSAPAEEEAAAGKAPASLETSLDPGPGSASLDSAPAARRSPWNVNFNSEASFIEKEPSPEAKSNVTADLQLEAGAGDEQLQCLESLDAATEDLLQQAFQETTQVLDAATGELQAFQEAAQVLDAATENLLQQAGKAGALFRNHQQVLRVLQESTAQAPALPLPGEKLKLARKPKPANPPAKNSTVVPAPGSSSRSLFTAALNKTRKLLLDSGWSIRQSIRERFSRVAPEPLCISPEGRPFVSLASACREWIRRNKHRKLAHVQLIARGESPGFCEFVAHTPGEMSFPGCSSTPARARRTREEMAVEMNKKLKTKGESTEKKKRGRPRAGCQTSTPARARQEEDEEARLAKKLTIFSWLMEMGVLTEEMKIQCGNKETSEFSTGVITGDGIVCGCCRKSFSVSGFRGHASSDSSSASGSDSGSGWELRLEDGRSMLECKLAALRAMKAKESEVLAVNEAIEVDENDDTCAVCGNGGQLVCCDHCPSTYHLKCVQLEKVPEGDWFCPRCCCASCLSNLYDTKSQADILYCDQCEREYHANCLNGEGMKYNSGDSRFCSRRCLKIFRGLRRLVGRPNAIEGGFTWTLLRSSELQPDLEAMAENSTRLALALALIQECFRPMIDFRTKTNIVTHILFNQRGDEKRLDFRGFYTLVLERDGEMISVASIRIHGAHAAEIPFIGTRSQYRRQGMCRRLISITEQILRALEVQTLVLPAIAEFAETWIGAFGFQRLSPAQGVQLMELNIVTFPGTSILYKPLTWLNCGRKPPPAEEQSYLSLLQDEDSEDEKKEEKAPEKIPEKIPEKSPEKIPEKTPEKLQCPEPEQLTDDEPPQLILPKKKPSSSKPEKGKKPTSKKTEQAPAPVDQTPVAQALAPDDDLQKPLKLVAKARSNSRVVKSPTWKSRFLKLLGPDQKPEEAPEAATSISPGANDGVRSVLSDEDGEPKLTPTPRTFSRRRPKAEQGQKDARIAGPLGSTQAAYLGIPKWPTSRRSKRARPVFKSHAAVASARRAPKKFNKRI